jgi:hypothetical protein
METSSTINNNSFFKTPSCSICLEPLEKDLTITKCAHVFHSKCIQNSVVKSRPDCPECRGKDPLSKMVIDPPVESSVLHAALEKIDRIIVKDFLRICEKIRLSDKKDYRPKLKKFMEENPSHELFELARYIQQSNVGAENKLNEALDKNIQEIEPKLSYYQHQVGINCQIFAVGLYFEYEDPRYKTLGDINLRKTTGEEIGKKLQLMVDHKIALNFQNRMLPSRKSLWDAGIRNENTLHMIPSSFGYFWDEEMRELGRKMQETSFES